MADRLTRVIGGDGTSSLSYALPPGVFQYVQSVLVEVDTSGSGDVTPTLTVFTHDNVPVADKQQNRAIDGGGQGRATWALRLADESPGGSSAALTGVYVHAGNTSIPNNAVTSFAFGFSLWDTDSMWTVANPTTITFNTAGFYEVGGACVWVGGGGGVRRLLPAVDFTFQAGQDDPGLATPGGLQWQTASAQYLVAAGDTATLNLYQNSGVAMLAAATMWATRIGP